ncbi:hypothetical protein AYI68_g3995 [Smittium mucronatum]|uniref:Uncharacterized protein n=1 Tax=Smittium mucronatum TaxID=133383 RepID=A0A1R0GYD8_9FUNG|nr:hypothetical protein AYI68_g3995 [Smittium mucronatum]
MNLININETIEVVRDSPTDEELKAAISRTHELGGIAIVNHIWWSNETQQDTLTARLPNHPSYDDLLEWGVDGFEVVNSYVFDLPTYYFVSNNSQRLIGVAGSDLHFPSPAFGYTVVKAQNYSKEGIFHEMKVTKRVSFLFDPTGSPYVNPLGLDGAPNNIPLTKKFSKIGPLMGISNYFTDFYTHITGMNMGFNQTFL